MKKFLGMVCLMAILAGIPMALLSGQSPGSKGGSKEVYRKFVQQNPGNAQAGKALFSNGKFSCLACHGKPGEGGDIGPDLAGVGGKHDQAYLIDAVLEPSKDIVPGYGSVTIYTKAGTVLTGRFESAGSTSVIFTDAQGQRKTIAKTEIETWHVQSEMPEGLEQLMTYQQFADILAFLKSL